MNDCVFCNIVNRTTPSEIVFENDQLIVIRDILPKAPVHLLVIPKQHIASVTDLVDDQAMLIGEVILEAKRQATAAGIEQSGYKLVFNVGKDGGQVVPHIHLHILGGKKLAE